MREELSKPMKRRWNLLLKICTAISQQKNGSAHCVQVRVVSDHYSIILQVEVDLFFSILSPQQDTFGPNSVSRTWAFRYPFLHRRLELFIGPEMACSDIIFQVGNTKHQYRRIDGIRFVLQHSFKPCDFGFLHLPYGGRLHKRVSHAVFTICYNA